MFYRMLHRMIHRQEVTTLRAARVCTGMHACMHGHAYGRARTPGMPQASLSFLDGPRDLRHRPENHRTGYQERASILGNINLRNGFKGLSGSNRPGEGSFGKVLVRRALPLDRVPSFLSLVLVLGAGGALQDAPQKKQSALGRTVGNRSFSTPYALTRDQVGHSVECSVECLIECSIRSNKRSLRWWMSTIFFFICPQ